MKEKLLIEITMYNRRINMKKEIERLKKAADKITNQKRGGWLNKIKQIELQIEKTKMNLEELGGTLSKTEMKKYIHLCRNYRDIDNYDEDNLRPF